MNIKKMAPFFFNNLIPPLVIQIKILNIAPKKPKIPLIY